MEYKREYKKYLTASVLDTANNKIASSTFITAFAVYLGLSTFAIGIYSVLDTITNIIQISYITFERFIEGIIVSILPILSLALPKDNIEGIKITFIISIIAFIILTMYLVRKNKTTVKEENVDAKK